MHRRKWTQPFLDGCAPFFHFHCAVSILTLKPRQGSWGGTGAKKAPPKRFLVKKVAGIDPRSREDYGKSHVIISEKVDKKAAKYMVKDLPYPYTSKAQYERSLQMPIGTEWNTRLGFQRGTLPRVVKKVRSSVCFHFCRVALLMSVSSLVLLSNLWSRCRKVFPVRVGLQVHTASLRVLMRIHIHITYLHGHHIQQN